MQSVAMGAVVDRAEHLGGDVETPPSAWRCQRTSSIAVPSVTHLLAISATIGVAIQLVTRWRLATAATCRSGAVR